MFNLNRLAIEMTRTMFIEEVLPLKQQFFRFAFSLVKSIQVAEDITQDVLIKIWQKGDDIDNLSAWGMRLTRNLSLDKLKAGSAKVVGLVSEPEMQQASPNPYQQSALNNSIEQIKITLKDLPEQQQMVWHLREIDGLTYDEIASTLSIKVDAVKVNLHRARKSLLSKLLNKEAYGY